MPEAIATAGEQEINRPQKEPVAKPQEDAESQPQKQSSMNLPILIMFLIGALMVDIFTWLIAFIPIVGLEIAGAISVVSNIFFTAALWLAGGRGIKQLFTAGIGGVFSKTGAVLAVYFMNLAITKTPAGQALEKTPGVAKKIPLTPQT